ncbi:MAG TPA: peptidoglycan editing factor PgeF [Phycisphaerales bacterium]|nr:peptidoglycan editing factor PgeF [Phycisphaerales bacterium]
MPQLHSANGLAGVPHAFSTRLGGVSRGQFDSLNFGNPSELVGDARDPRENIARNISLVLDAMGATGREVVQVHQVHGGEVHVVRAGQATHHGRDDTKADAIVTDDPARIAMVRIADCGPVLLACETGRVVAAVHAGWRGVLAGIVPNAIAVMHELGARDIHAAIGPCIRVDAFEVGEDVAQQFTAAFPRVPVVHRRAGWPKPHVDVVTAITTQLQAAGIAHIDVVGECSFARSDLYFSHRRDGSRSGRMAAFIGPRVSA